MVNDKADDITTFYNTTHIADVSRRGYYVEKLNLFFSVLTLKKKKNNLHILDIGCNDGELTKMYAKYGKVLGIDVNRESVKECKKRGVKCIATDIAGITKQYKSSFDIVIAGDIIEHIFDTDKFIKEILTVLEPNGVLLLTTPNVASFGRRIMLLFGISPYLEYSKSLPSKEFSVGHIRYYTATTLKQQLLFFGFKNVKIYGDRINLLSSIHIPFGIAKHIPSLSRNLLVIAQK